MSIEVRQMTIKSTLVSERNEAHRSEPDRVDIDRLEFTVSEMVSVDI